MLQGAVWSSETIFIGSVVREEDRGNDLPRLVHLRVLRLLRGSAKREIAKKADVLLIGTWIDDSTAVAKEILSGKAASTRLRVRSPLR
jgi:hypothetical protein